MGTIIQFPGVTSRGSEWARLRRAEAKALQTAAPEPQLAIGWRLAEKLAVNCFTVNALPQPWYAVVVGAYFITLAAVLVPLLSFIAAGAIIVGAICVVYVFVRCSVSKEE